LKASICDVTLSAGIGRTTPLSKLMKAQERSK
jgi:hypothetical protein